MYRFRMAFLKDLRILLRDRTGILMMLLMPVALVIVISLVQNSVYELVGDRKIPMILLNKDSGRANHDLVTNLKQNPLLAWTEVREKETDLSSILRSGNAMAILIIPRGYSEQLMGEINTITREVEREFGLSVDSLKKEPERMKDSLQIVYNPAISPSFQQAIEGAIQNQLSVMKNKMLVAGLYTGITGKPASEDYLRTIGGKPSGFKRQITGNLQSGKLPDSTQHNISAWTVFAMFFMVISLGGNLVGEKLSGTYQRLKILPGGYGMVLVAKQLVYLLMALCLMAVIFTLGVFLFPVIGLPALTLPENIPGLFILSVFCGWCAVSYATCIGVFSGSREQSSGFGAASVVILAALGGVFVPTFAMPATFLPIAKISPFYWALDAFYGLFLEGLSTKEVIIKALPLPCSALIFESLAFWGLRRRSF